MNIKSQVIDSTFGIPTSLDPCCLVYGTTGCNFGGFDQAFLAVHLDDGRIILAGDTRWQGESDFAMARLMPDGQYDQTAGPDGQVRIDLGYPNDSCLAAALYQNDRILMGGCVRQPGTAKYVDLIARVDFDGNLDPFFGTSGYLTIDLPSAHEMITKISALPDGRIIVAGNAWYGTSFVFPDSVNVFVGRLLPDGKVDTTFGIDGFVFRRWEKTCNAALIGDIAVDMFDRIVITGGSYDPYPNNYFGNEYCHHNIFLFRYLPNGEPDPSFGVNGSLELEYTGAGRGNALLLYKDGRILLAGASGLLDTYPLYFFLARLMPDGTPDFTFADNGRFRKALLNYGLFSGGNVEPFGLLRMRGRILVGVLNEITGDDLGFGAVCLREDGKIDSTFGKGGRFNPFPDIGMQSFINQISSTANNCFFLSGYTRILQPNNMAIVKIRWDNVSDITEQPWLNEIKIYPNPAADRVTITTTQTDSEGIVRVTDLQGRLVQESILKDGLAIFPTTGLPNGMYMVQILSKEGSIFATRKLVVQH